LKRDTQDCFRFAALQSAFAAQVLARHGVTPEHLDTMYLVQDCGLPQEQIASRSDAAVAILKKLGKWWRFAAVLLGVLPRWLRNWGYNWIARRRYRLFGKYDACPLPESRHQRKFLDS
jgi:predicted DCC family thiol-disulfide oxidoreductase YuxK